jgi:DNA-binding SARP family transcriptional activator
MEIYLMGRFSVRRAGEETESGALGGRLLRTLIEVLVIRRGTFVPNDVLIEALWPIQPPADPVANLKVLVNRARRALGDGSAILTGNAGYSFTNQDRCFVDTETFLNHVQSGQRHMTNGAAFPALNDFRAALELWSGDPLAEDAYEDWAQGYRARMIAAHQEALEGGAAAALTAGSVPEAVNLAQAAMKHEPMRERNHLILAQALAASGDTAAALEVLDAFRRRFADELGLDLSVEAVDLQTRLLKRDALAAQPGSRAGAPPRLGDLPFVGREVPILRLWESFSGEHSTLAIVMGAAGSGKSRLLREVAASLSKPIISAGAFLAEREEPWALGRVLLHRTLAVMPDAAMEIPDRAAGALADIIPELAQIRPVSAPPADFETSRALALQGAVRIISAAASVGSILMVDDLQWADPTSLTLLGLVARRVPGLNLLVACRTEEVDPRGRAAGFLREISTTHPYVFRTELKPLSAEEVAGLVADEQLATMLATETYATPFVVTEILRALAAEGNLERALDGRLRVLNEYAVAQAREAARQGRRLSVRARVDRQPLEAREVLSVLSLLGREAPARLIASAILREPAEVLRDLEVLSRAGLVRLGSEGWAAGHDLIAETISEELDSSERGRLHEMIARALESWQADPWERARHLVGAGDIGAACETYAEGARIALERFANGEAQSLADGALNLNPQSPSRATLLEIRAEALARLGMLDDARDDLRTSLAIRRSGPERALTLTRLALLNSSSQDYGRAGELIEIALVEAGEDPAARAEALVGGAIIDLNTNRFERAETRRSEALALFREVGNARGVAGILEAQALGAFFQGRIRESVELLDRAVTLFADLGELIHVGGLRCTRGLAVACMKQEYEGLAEIDEGIDLARLVGNPEIEALGLWFRCEVLIGLGRAEEAIRDAEDALAIAREIGHRESTAMALIGLGGALHLMGQLDQAERVLHEAEQTAKGMPVFSGSAAARLATVLISRNDLDAAEQLVGRALSEGAPFGQYEASLAMSRIAFARGDPAAPQIAAEALALAEAGGHLAIAAQLEALLASGPPPRSKRTKSSPDSAAGPTGTGKSVHKSSPG